MYVHVYGEDKHFWASHYLFQRTKSLHSHNLTLTTIFQNSDPDLSSSVFFRKSLCTTLDKRNTVSLKPC